MMRRIKGYVVTGNAVGALLKAGSRTIEVASEIPDSAEFFTAYFDSARNAFVCVFEDESFHPLSEGALIPIEVGVFSATTQEHSNGP